MESLAPVLVDEMELLVDLMPADTHVLVLDPERARTRAHDLVATSEEFLGASWAAAAGGGTAPIDLGAASYRELGDVRGQALDRDQSWWSLSPFGLDAEEGTPEPAALSGQAGTALPRRRGTAIADIERWRADGYRVVVVHPGHGPAQRMVEALGERDVPARLVEQLEADAARPAWSR